MLRRQPVGAGDGRRGKGDDVAERANERRLVLLTGAAGRIGSAFFADSGDRYRFRLADRSADTLATDPSPEADFYGSLLDNNIKGTYNVFRAAADEGCRRVIFASSVHAVLGYGRDVQAHPESPVRPVNMYGVSKCFGEAVAACFAAAGLSSIAIRIGAYEADWIRQNPTAEAMSMFLSARDMNQLLVRCIEADGVGFAIVHAVSDNRFKRLDIASTRDLLGYAPEDDAFQIFGADLRD